MKRVMWGAVWGWVGKEVWVEVLGFGFRGVRRGQEID